MWPGRQTCFCNTQAHELRTGGYARAAPRLTPGKVALFILAGGRRCPEGSQRTKARRPGWAGGWGQAKDSFGNCCASVTKPCKPAALDFGISLFLSPHQRMCQCLCLHNNLVVFSRSPLKSQKCSNRDTWASSNEEDSVAHGPKASSIPHHCKR